MTISNRMDKDQAMKELNAQVVELTIFIQQLVTPSQEIPVETSTPHNSILGRSQQGGKNEELDEGHLGLDWRVAAIGDKAVDVGVEMHKFFLILKVEVGKEIEDCIAFIKYYELMYPKLQVIRTLSAKVLEK